MAKLIKEVAPKKENEIIVKIGEVSVTLVKNSNLYKVKDKVKYLRQIIWDKETESIITEIEKELQK